MRATRTAALLLTALAACASPARYRDVEGRPVATTARLDADVAPLEVTCPRAGRDWIVPAPHAFMAGAHVGTQRPYVRDVAHLCAKIRAADE